VGKILLVLLEDTQYKKVVSSAVDSAGQEGEIILLRIFPKSPLDDMVGIGDKGLDAKKGKRAKARAALDEMVDYGRHRRRDVEPPHFSILMREGEPAEIVLALDKSARPDMIVFPESHSRLVSTGSGDFVSFLKKNSSTPLRVVGD